MNYFVSAENHAYHHWQLELLIESFKLLKLEDSLLIALAENNYHNYSKNLLAHKKVFVHNNLGAELKHSHINRVYSLNIALQKELIKPPILVLHPDMLLVKPITNNTDIIFQLEDFPKNKKIEPLVKKILKIKKLESNFWLNLGDTICLQKFPNSLVERTLKLTEYLIRINDKYAEKTAWVISLLEHFGNFSYYGSYNIENTMLDGGLNNVINYKHGLPPFFNKRMFNFKEDFSMGNPLKILLEHNPNPVTNYIQKIVSSYKIEDKEIGNNSLYSPIPVVKVSTPRNK